MVIKFTNEWMMSMILKFVPTKAFVIIIIKNEIILWSLQNNYLKSFYSTLNIQEQNENEIVFLKKIIKHKKSDQVNICMNEIISQLSYNSSENNK